MTRFPRSLDQPSFATIGSITVSWRARLNGLLEDTLSESFVNEGVFSAFDLLGVAGSDAAILVVSDSASRFEDSETIEKLALIKDVFNEEGT